ncbi:Phenazine biosynthesis-like domain-containing protein [Portunus trituberculatus]|uniref:Phenazine biosynthesis-like domain-containing protein n=1 Tax=Portunus trituberculatus TaxID=210409 RepID=A0A5B7K312_PORTR|nr:Phenazine biosynthesis-like domain-containing protein [Portunus trituberculatus]
MDFPNNEATSLTDEEAQRLKPLVAATCSGMAVQEVLLCRTLKYLLVRLSDSYSSKDLEVLLPDYSAMRRAHDGSQVMAVIVTVPGKEDSSYHAFSRFFAPLYGVDEDPVTGSAHTVLGPYWAKHLNTDNLTSKLITFTLSF